MGDKIQEAYKVGREMPLEKVKEFYDEWYKQGNYDEILKDAGCEGPQEVAKRIARLVNNKDAMILDIGAGTGLVGEELYKLGYTNICAIDPSEESLRLCREKGCYRDYKLSLVGPERLPFDDNAVDGAMSSAAFSPGHCDGTSLKEIMRVLRPGGHVVIGARRTYFDDHHDNFNFRQVSDELVSKKVCSLARDDVPNYSPYAMGAALMFTKA